MFYQNGQLREKVRAISSANQFRKLFQVESKRKRLSRSNPIFGGSGGVGIRTPRTIVCIRKINAVPQVISGQN
ncbi:hypothetical protein Y032_0002g745 [Ancylostoma ceylanicum]|uniref:Uncharacterized protein n=1 Tax=Ancylostoma ceylanicum TaxID=53326 RepID=A0A016W2Y5_9BILA|nr:hypothetical protein Y032_0002g745 [Ancylostoma ceylanicum]